MEALAFLHNPKLLPEYEDCGPGVLKYGKHGDIKPSNVLWFQSAGHGSLVVTDFGIGEFHGTNSRSNIPNKGLPNTPSYRPPECDIEGGRISCLFDVWGLGCLFLEMACWLLRGDKGRKCFETDRSTPFYDSSFGAGTVATFFDIQRDDQTDTEELHILMVKNTVTELSEGERASRESFLGEDVNMD
jgi:serine/threonine protein kinase